MNSRFYNPTTGRFLTQDTYSGNVYEPWTQHLYAYTGNNPVNYIDPTGHRPIYASDPDMETDEMREASFAAVNKAAKANRSKTIIHDQLAGNPTPTPSNSVASVVIRASVTSAILTGTDNANARINCKNTTITANEYYKNQGFNRTERRSMMQKGVFSKDTVYTLNNTIEDAFERNFGILNTALFGANLILDIQDNQGWGIAKAMVADAGGYGLGVLAGIGIGLLPESVPILATVAITALAG